MTERSGIYAILHKPSSRYYVGSAGNISKRWHSHRKMLFADTHRNQKLQAAWNKYGSIEFEFAVLELTENLTEREQFWMDFLKGYTHGFNLCPVARSSRGRVIPENERAMRREILASLRTKAQSVSAKTKRTITRREQRTLGQKLTWTQVLEIRAQYQQSSKFGRGRKQRKNGGVTLASLAQRHGVGIVTIYDVVREKTWKSDPEAQS